MEYVLQSSFHKPDPAGNLEALAVDQILQFRFEMCRGTV